MKIHVDLERCVGSGMCTGIAPELFELDGTGKVVVLDDSPDPDLLQKVDAAIVCCPVEAISRTE